MLEERREGLEGQPVHLRHGLDNADADFNMPKPDHPVDLNSKGLRV